jgi:1-deoxyxylulose-5-phosphate synthase
MKTTTLAHTDLTVSRACLGTMMFGSQTDQPTASRMVDVCIDRGVNFVDTANVYNLGESETTLGNLLKGRRSRFVVASKVGMKMGDSFGESGLSAGAVVKCLDDSLRRLQCEYLDIYYLHVPDHASAIEETMEMLDRLVKAGKVRYPAISNYAAWQACELLWLSEKHGFMAPMISQPLYNLLARGIEQEYIPFCKRFKLSMVVYNPLARGLLTGSQNREVYLSGAAPHQSEWSVDRYRHPAFFDAVDELRGIAEQADRSLIDLAYNWLLHHTPTDCVIVGAANADQFEQNLDVLDHGPLPHEAVTGCDAVWQKLRGTIPRYNR